MILLMKSRVRKRLLLLLSVIASWDSEVKNNRFDGIKKKRYILKMLWIFHSSFFVCLQVVP